MPARAGAGHEPDDTFPLAPDLKTARSRIYGSGVALIICAVVMIPCFWAALIWPFLLVVTSIATGIMTLMHTDTDYSLRANQCCCMPRRAISVLFYAYCCVLLMALGTIASAAFVVNYTIEEGKPSAVPPPETLAPLPSSTSAASASAVPLPPPIMEKGDGMPTVRGFAYLMIGLSSATLIASIVGVRHLFKVKWRFEEVLDPSRSTAFPVVEPVTVDGVVFTQHPADDHTNNEEEEEETEDADATDDDARAVNRMNVEVEAGTEGASQSLAESRNADAVLNSTNLNHNYQGGDDDDVDGLARRSMSSSSPDAPRLSGRKRESRAERAAAAEAAKIKAEERRAAEAADVPWHQRWRLYVSDRLPGRLARFSRGSSGRRSDSESPPPAVVSADGSPPPPGLGASSVGGETNARVNNNATCTGEEQQEFATVVVNVTGVKDSVSPAHALLTTPTTPAPVANKETNNAVESIDHSTTNGFATTTTSSTLQTSSVASVGPPRSSGIRGDHHRHEDADTGVEMHSFTAPPPPDVGPVTAAPGASIPLSSNMARTSTGHSQHRVGGATVHFDDQVHTTSQSSSKPADRPSDGALAATGVKGDVVRTLSRASSVSAPYGDDSTASGRDSDPSSSLRMLSGGLSGGGLSGGGLSGGGLQSNSMRRLSGGLSGGGLHSNSDSSRPMFWSISKSEASLPGAPPYPHSPIPVGYLPPDDDDADGNDEGDGAQRHHHGVQQHDMLPVRVLEQHSSLESEARRLSQAQAQAHQVQAPGGHSILRRSDPSSESHHSMIAGREQRRDRNHTALQISHTPIPDNAARRTVADDDDDDDEIADIARRMDTFRRQEEEQLQHTNSQRGNDAVRDGVSLDLSIGEAGAGLGGNSQNTPPAAVATLIGAKSGLRGVIAPAVRPTTPDVKQEAAEVLLHERAPETVDATSGGLEHSSRGSSQAKPPPVGKLSEEPTQRVKPRAASFPQSHGTMETTTSGGLTESLSGSKPRALSSMQSQMGPRHLSVSHGPSHGLGRTSSSFTSYSFSPSSRSQSPTPATLSLHRSPKPQQQTSQQAPQQTSQQEPQQGQRPLAVSTPAMTHSQNSQSVAGHRTMSTDVKATETEATRSHQPPLSSTRSLGRGTAPQQQQQQSADLPPTLQGLRATSAPEPGRSELPSAVDGSAPELLRAHDREDAQHVPRGVVLEEEAEAETSMVHVPIDDDRL